MSYQYLEEVSHLRVSRPTFHTWLQILDEVQVNSVQRGNTVEDDVNVLTWYDHMGWLVHHSDQRVHVLERGIITTVNSTATHRH